MSPAPQAAQWFVTKSDGQEAGPFSNQQMKTLVAQAKIGPSTLVRRGDTPKAIPAANVQGLLTAKSTVAVSRAAAPTPAPAKSSAAKSPPPVPPEVDGIDPEAYDDDNDGYDDDGDPEAAQRAPVGIRIVSALIDGVAYSLLVVIGIIIFMTVSFAPIVSEAGRIETRWQQEVDRMLASNNIEHHKRILGIERFPRPDESTDSIPDQIEAYKRMFASVDSEPDPGALRDLIVLEWRQRREGGGPDGPVTEEEREAVVNWSQYEEFETFVRRREISLRRELRGSVERLQSVAGIIRQDQEAAARSSGIRAVIFGVVLFPLLFFAMPLCERYLGATPGKLLMGYQVATMSNHRIGFFKALLRMVLRLIPFYFVTVFTASRQGLHDSLSGTQVLPKDMVSEAPRGRKARAARKGGGRRRRR
ncbi:MAG: RDD family protein [Planctomycetota bacterium]|nr:MAG: RDD family protein [Planctomycetota bacterium]